MKNYKTILKVLFHLLFWVAFFWYFTTNNNLRPFPAVHLYKEYVIAAVILVASYLVYFFLTPKYYLAGYLDRFVMSVVVLVLALNIFEFTLLRNDLLLWKTAFPREYYEPHYLQMFLLVMVRNICILGFFFLLRSNRHYAELNRAERKGLLNNTSYYNIVVSSKQVETVKVTEIMYVRHQKNYSYFYLSDGTHYPQYVSLTKVIEELPESLFLRISRSTIINTAYIMRFEKDIFTLQAIREAAVVEANLPISATYKDEVEAYLATLVQKTNH